MKLVIIAGTSGVGKTPVLVHTLNNLKDKLNASVVKIDCLYNDDKKQSRNQGFPTMVGF